MSYRAVKHKFTGDTVAITSYDAAKTNLGTLMVQQTGTLATDKFVGPLPIGVATPMQEVVSIAGTVSVSTTSVTGTSTAFTPSMVGMLIGFGSTNPASVTTWYTITARASATGISIAPSGGTIAAGTPYVIVSSIPIMYPHVITYNSTIDWVFGIENLATASTARRIVLYEYNKTTSVYTWKGFINATLLSGANANTIRGFRALRYLHTAGTVSGSGTTITGTGTSWQTEGVAIGARIGFGSTNPSEINNYNWRNIADTTDNTSITILNNDNVATFVYNWHGAALSSDGTKIAACASAGYIYTSTDSGVTWTERTSSGVRQWTEIASSSDGTKLAACVNGGYIYTSTDSGVTWSTNSNSSGVANWYGITSSSDGTKLAATVNNGYIYTSTDSGVTWSTNSNSSGSRSWSSITSSSDGTKLAAFVYNGYIYTSTDSGVTWSTNSNSSGSRNWSGITSSSDGTKLAASEYGGYIYTSTDSGVTWSTNSNSSGPGNWYDVTSSSDGTKLAATVSNGYIYTSTDSGVTWSTNSNSSGSRAWWKIASSSDGTKLVAPIPSGKIYISTNSGTTWTLKGEVSLSDSPYVIEELRFAITTTQATTSANGGLFLVKGINYSDFIPTGTTIAAATSTDDQKAVYWLSDAGTSGNIVTNTSACGLAIADEVNKGLHYAYVLDGFGSTFARVYRYNLRATGAIASGKMTMSVAYYTTGTVEVAGTTVTGSGTTFTIAMVGMKIGFNTTSPANVTTWYTISEYTSDTSITLATSAGTISAGAVYIIDSADVVTTAPQLVTGTLSGVNNGRVGTLLHGPGANEESLYFVTTTRIYRAALSKIFAGNLGWISDNRPEIPTGSVSTFPATSLLSSCEIASSIDRLIVLSTGAGGVRNYVTKYPQSAGDAFDHIWGVDDKQQDQASSLGSAYITSGTVDVSSTAVTGTNTFFTPAMVGYQIGFGTTDPGAVVDWYTISEYTSDTSITLSTSAGTIGGGSSYVIDWNSYTVPHFNTASQVTSVWSENGITHIVKHGTTAGLSQMYALPLSAHWTYAATTNQRVITPAIYTQDCTNFYSVAVSQEVSLGATGEFRVSTESYKMYCRTDGIDNNTGEWILVPRDGDLAGIASAPRIQFMFEFYTIGIIGIPARIMSLTVMYDDTTTDSHYQPSAGLSSGANKQFAWRFATAFGGTVPTLRVRLYDAVTNNLLVDDYTTSPDGTWEKSTNSGGAWIAYNTTDKGNETTYIRYTPASLGDNIKVRAVLTQ